MPVLKSHYTHPAAQGLSLQTPWVHPVLQVSGQSRQVPVVKSHYLHPAAQGLSLQTPLVQPVLQVAGQSKQTPWLLQPALQVAGQETHALLSTDGTNGVLQVEHIWSSEHSRHISILQVTHNEPSLLG